VTVNATGRVKQLDVAYGASDKGLTVIRVNIPPAAQPRTLLPLNGTIPTATRALVLGVVGCDQRVPAAHQEIHYSG